MKDRSLLITDIFRRSEIIFPISLYNNSRSILQCRSMSNILENSESSRILSQSLIWESLDYAHKMHWYNKTLSSHRELSVRPSTSFLSSGFCMGDGRRFS